VSPLALLSWLGVALWISGPRRVFIDLAHWLASLQSHPRRESGCKGIGLGSLASRVLLSILLAGFSAFGSIPFSPELKGGDAYGKARKGER